MPSLKVPVLGFLFVSFRPSLIRSHSCLSGASLLLSLSGFPLPFRFLSSASLPVPATQPLLLPFLLFPASPHSGFPGAPFRFRFQAFPFLSGLISHAFLKGSCTRLPVCFLSSFPASLPQPFHRCLPYAFASGIFHFRSAFFRPLLLGSDYSAFRSFLSLLPAFPCRRFPRCFFLFRPACFHAFLPIPVLGLL